ncbi:MAG: response regulator [Thermodesulfobacteriota bacterium]|nr:response regulator [Thermodesulfobacteriota bacterium]
MKVLIVDDKASIRSEMKKVLKQLGFKDITEAVDGNDAWFKLKAEFEGKKPDKYDLIISDMEMPEMSGLDLLKAVRGDDELKEMPFIMVTTVNSKDVIIKTMKLGIKAYIIKPFDVQSVAAKLAQAGLLG